MFLGQILVKSATNSTNTLKNVLENLTNILYCSFLFQNFGGGAENNPERSSISDECYFYAKYDKTHQLEHVFLKVFREASPIARVYPGV